MSNTGGYYREILSHGKEKLIVLLPSMGSLSSPTSSPAAITVKGMKKRLKGSRNRVCVVVYPGFERSHGYFPGENILGNVEKLLGEIERESESRISRIIGDGYGGMVALGLKGASARYAETEVVLTSPTISFNYMPKHSGGLHPEGSDDRCTLGFMASCPGRRVGPNRRTDYECVRKRLVSHEMIPDPFEQKVSLSRARVYHYKEDFEFCVTKSFCDLKDVPLVDPEGKKHCLFNFDFDLFNQILS